MDGFSGYWVPPFAGIIAFVEIFSGVGSLSHCNLGLLCVVAAALGLFKVHDANCFGNLTFAMFAA